MNESLPCPGCGTPLPPEATGCQICMRARTKHEIVRGYAQLRESKARRRRLPLMVVVFALVAGTAIKFGWDFRAVIRTSAGAARTRAAAWYDRFTDPKNYAPRGAATAENVRANAPPSTPPPPAPASSPAVRRDERPATAPPPSPPSSGETAASSPAVKPPVAKNAWRVSGIVYDLSSLDPVPNSEITFFGDYRKPVTTITGADGAYEVDLSKSDGWTVGVNAPDRRADKMGGIVPGWRRGQVLDVDPPYRVRDSDERQAAVDAISDGDLAPAAVGWKRSASNVRLDLVVVPAPIPSKPYDPRFPAR